MSCSIRDARPSPPLARLRRKMNKGIPYGLEYVATVRFPTVNLIATIRAFNQRAGKLSAVLAAAVWLNLTVVPCLMAMPLAVSDQAADCEHCAQSEHCRESEPGQGQAALELSCGGGHCLMPADNTSGGVQGPVTEWQPDSVIPVSTVLPGFISQPAAVAWVSPWPVPFLPCPIYLSNCSFLN